MPFGDPAQGMRNGAPACRSQQNPLVLNVECLAGELHQHRNRSRASRNLLGACSRSRSRCARAAELEHNVPRRQAAYLTTRTYAVLAWDGETRP